MHDNCRVSVHDNYVAQFMQSSRIRMQTSFLLRARWQWRSIFHEKSRKCLHQWLRSIYRLNIDIKIWSLQIVFRMRLRNFEYLTFAGNWEWINKSFWNIIRISGWVDCHWDPSTVWTTDPVSQMIANSFSCWHCAGEFSGFQDCCTTFLNFNVRAIVHRYWIRIELVRLTWTVVMKSPLSQASSLTHSVAGLPLTVACHASGYWVAEWLPQMVTF